MFARHWTLAVITAAVALAARPAFAQRPLVGAVFYARDSQFWQQIELGMKDAAKKNGIDLQFELSRRQLSTEAQVVDDLMTRGIKALVISALDKDASANALRSVRAEHLPIVEFNTFLADKSLVTNSVGVDNRELAATVGDEMAKKIRTQMGGHAKIGLIPLPDINPGSRVRKDSVMAALKGVKVDVVATIERATPEEGANAVESILRRDPTTQVIWSSNSGILAGASSTVERQHADVQLYGVDMSGDLAQAMLQPDSRIIAVSDQQPYKLGYLAIEAAAEDIKGEETAPYMQVAVKLYRKSDQASLKQYLHVVQSSGK